ncbi:MAG: FAD-linked oxidase C-terminal domain-containing protein [Pseudomonadota bacterium]|nr:FAD-linked oxidase C-terminal domain-containing protein [Pseudomonadota bacterium]
MDALTPDFVNRLRTAAGADNIITAPEDCWAYGYDNSRQHALPDAVAFAHDHEQVARIVECCCQEGVSLVVRGRGTGTTGATVPLNGGLVLSTERMDRILDMDPENRIIRVQPGAINQAVQDAASKHGFFWPPDPTSAGYCTVGGNLAYNSAGPRALKYGTPRENTLGLLAVTGLGAPIRTGVRTTKGVVGYDLTRLLIGSEGTLAVITEATLKLIPLPETVHTLQAVYSGVDTAAEAISRIMAQPAVPRSLEFMDACAIDMIRDYAQVDVPTGAGALLMIEVDGSEQAVAAAAATIMQAGQIEGCLRMRAARDEGEVREMWAARKALSPALRTIAPEKINEDVVVPVSEIPSLIGGLTVLSEKHRIPIVNFGHAGNGNIHVNLLIDPDIDGITERAERCLAEVFDLVLKLGGTLSGEHGVGIAKRDYIDREIDSVTLDLMRRIKAQFDPRGILNPAKVFPVDAASGNG